jgi:hypothetical protein
VNRLATLLDIPAATIQSQFAKGSAVPPPRANVSSDVPAEECRGYKQAITLSGQLYETGAGTFLDLLDAQRSLMAEDALVQSEWRSQKHKSHFCKALGGGWAGAASTN